MSFEEDAPPHDHEWVVIHHTDVEGRHYCPTGFADCVHCDEIRTLSDEEAAAGCRIPWGALPEDDKGDGGPPA